MSPGPGGRRAGARVAPLILAFAVACGGSEVGPPDNPAPILESLEPALVSRSAGPVSVDILGLGFVEGAEARWNGEARATGYVGPTHLTVTLTPQDLLAASGDIDVVNPAPGGGASSALTLVVGNPTPTLASISPTQAPAVVTSELTLQAQGSDFVLGASPSVLLWNGIPLTTEVTSTTQLSGTVPDYLLRVGHAAEIAVRNPGPGGGVSSPVYFAVENPVPSVTGTEPDGVPALTDAALEVLGSGFVNGATVWIGGTQITPISTSATRLAVQVPGTATAGGQSTTSVRVENPGPGGGSSNTVGLTVWLAPPRIDYVTPSRLFAGSPDITVVITGADFDPSAVVLWEGSQRTATVVSSQRIEVTIPASDLTLEGTFDLTVLNPGDSGQASAQITVLPAGAAITRVVAERWGKLQLVFSELDGSDATVVGIPEGGSRVDASPIGLTAVYHSDQGRVMEMDPTTGIARRLTTTADESTLVGEQWPRYSPDGAWVYFTGTNRNTSRLEIWRARTDGSGAELVVGDATRSLEYPAPAHDGRRVLYTSNGEYWIYDYDTSSSTRLGERGLNSRWSPGDEWIVYLADGWDLRAVRPDGTDGFTLVSSVDVGFGFDFSPDGSSIVATTQAGDPILIDFPSGSIQSQPGLGRIGSVAWFGP